MKHVLQSTTDFLFSKNMKGMELLILGILLFWRYGHDLQSVTFQPDETFWIASSLRLDKFFSGDFYSPIWNEPFVNYEVRPIPSYIVAVSQRLGGISPEELPTYWDWQLTNDENISRGAMPSDDELWWSRLPMVFIAVFSLLGITFFLAKTHSRMAGYVFVLASLNDYFLLHLRRAMSEAPLLLFTVLVAYTSYRLLLAAKEGSNKKIILWSVITGVLSGLAGQSKLTGLACTAIPVLSTLILFLGSASSLERSKIRTLLTVAILVTLSSLLVFIAAYPFFFEDTLYRTVGTFYFRNVVVQGQMQAYPQQVILPDNRFSILFQRIFEYPLTSTSDGIFASILPWVNFFLAMFGIMYLIKQIWIRGDGWERALVLLTAALMCAGPMLFVPFDWDRYYLYPIVFSCVFFSIGVGQLFFQGTAAALKR